MSSTTAQRIDQPAVGLRPDQVVFGRHMLTQAATKGFTRDQIRDALAHPYKVTDVTAHPGQKRWCGRGPVTADGNHLPGIAIVMEPIGGGRWRAVTAYLDGVITDMRADQAHDPRAMASSRLARR